jgi:3-methylcrotonyl-CoA carboxylase alpha subunit
VRIDNGRRLAYAVAMGTETWVWLDGNAYKVAVEGPSERATHGRADDMAMAAPMPATVRAIAVSVGQPVTTGDVLIVLEAMKMELTIKAPRDGTVRAVHCAQGELVQTDIALLELEP